MEKYYYSTIACKSLQFKLSLNICVVFILTLYQHKINVGMYN